MIDYLAPDRETSALVDTRRPMLAVVEDLTDAEAEAGGPIEAEAGDPIEAGEREPEAPGPDEPGGDQGVPADGPPVLGGPAEDDPAGAEPEPEGTPLDIPLELEGPDVAANDFRILGAPTIGLDTFAAVLKRAKSPAAGEAAGMYAQAVKYGVDPAILLAIMQHESGFGRAGIAVGRQNGWGLRWYPSYSDLGGSNRGGWTHFPTWTAGAAAASRLLASGLYGKSGKYNTARRFPFRWAPAGDGGNRPSHYGAAIVAAIRSWGGKPGVSTGSLGAAAVGRLDGGGGKPKHRARARTGKVRAKAAEAPAPATGSQGSTTDLSGVIIIGAVGLGLIALLLALGGGRSSEG